MKTHSARVQGCVVHIDEEAKAKGLDSIGSNRSNRFVLSPSLRAR